MDFISQFIDHGGPMGLVAAVFLWLYVQERKDRITAQATNVTLMEARRIDAIEARNDVTSMIPGISQALFGLKEKIETGKTTEVPK